MPRGSKIEYNISDEVQSYFRTRGKVKFEEDAPTLPNSGASTTRNQQTTSNLFKSDLSTNAITTSSNLPSVNRATPVIEFHRRKITPTFDAAVTP